MLDLTDWQNKKYQTRDGIPVRILCIDAKSPYPIVGLVEFFGRPDNESVETWTSAGKLINQLEEQYGRDLINAKTKREGWVNINERMRCGGIYATQELANDCATPLRVACLPIEWEE
jgi:hypothetical protein